MILILNSITPSDMNFQTILMPKVNFAKIMSEKIWSIGTILISILKYALVKLLWYADKTDDVGFLLSKRPIRQIGQLL